MFTKTELIRWTITQALMTVTVLVLLVVGAAIGLTLVAVRDYQSQIPEPTVAVEAEIIPASLLEQIPAESKLDFWYAREYGRVEDTVQSTIIPASLLEQIPAESKLPFWYARVYGNEAENGRAEIIPASQ